MTPWGEFRIWRLVFRWLPARRPFPRQWLIGWARDE